MPIESRWCRVLHAEVAMTTSFGGEVMSIACTHFDPMTKACRLKRDSKLSPPLSQLLERVSAETLGDRGPRCNFA
jgi:hypothetical protein